MDSIAHCNVNAMGTTIIPGGAPKPAKMMNMLENCAPFNCTDMQKENKRIFPLCNKDDKQNNRARGHRVSAKFIGRNALQTNQSPVGR